MRQWQRKNIFAILWTAWIQAIFCVILGCSRYDYVRDADEQAYRLVAQKSNDPRWEQPDFAVELDPRSRYFDPYDEVSPPMPPDDPASAQFMRKVDGKKHWPFWDEYGHRPNLENPCWEMELPDYVEIADDGKIKLGLEEAVRLAIIHKPDYQEQFETVYLSALDVSTERFRFDTQFFGSFFQGYTNRGPETPNIARGPGFNRLNPPNSSSQWNFDSELTARRQLATAGELLVGFANSTVFELVGRNSDISTSVLNFSMVQPLLRAGGRAFAMEQLTIVERALLANLRALEQFRQGFYTDVAIGSSGVQGPRRRGGFFGGTGLTGFTGTGSGGFGGVAQGTGFGRGFGDGGGGTGGGAGTTGFAGGGAGTVGGFLGLLQRTQQIRNSEQSLQLLRGTLELMQNYIEAGLIDFAQVALFQQNIETEKATLLQAQIGFQDALEGYLIGTLGLPPDLPVELDDGVVEPFRFTTDEVLDLQDRLSELVAKFGDEQTPSTEANKNLLEETKSLVEDIGDLVGDVKGDLEKYDERIGVRLERMNKEEQSLVKASREDMEKRLTDAIAQLKKAREDLEMLQQQLDVAKPNDIAGALLPLIRTLQYDIVGELNMIQARSKLGIIVIQDVTLDPEKALEIARANRLDWMNNRAALVDTWRLIQFNANRLKSDVSIRFDGDISTLGGDNPFKFREETGSIRASLQFDPPFTRLTERNNFRQQLIEYQQSRRQLIQYEDRVFFSLRQILRNLDQLKVNLEIQRTAVDLAIQRVDLTREELNKPVPPPMPGQPAGTLGPTAALDLVNALSDLRNTQNNFLSVYLNYYATRMVLMRELGLMRIDDNGMWIDEPLDVAIASVQQYDCDLPPDVPSEWLDLKPMEEPVPAGELPETPQPAPVPIPEPKDDEKGRAAMRLPASRPKSRVPAS